jgi:hypothetical protein
LKELTLENPKHKVSEWRKTRRYDLCLSFITQVLKDFDIATDRSHVDLMSFLGEVASAIDSALDHLSLQDKEKVYWSFPPFFKELLKVDTASEFRLICENYVIDKQIDLSTPLHYDLFYKLVSDVKLLQIERELNNFSLAVIHASILKQKAVRVRELSQSIKLEGKAAVEFLVLFLQRSSLLNHSRNHLRLKRYLIILERILNLADDLLDGRKDYKTGVFRLRLGPVYYFHFLRKMIAQISYAFLMQPFLFTKHSIHFSFRYLLLESKLQMNAIPK